MATYNFADGGEIFYNGDLHQIINGPATLTPNVAYYDSFTLSHIGGSDNYYFNGNNNFEINGTPFVGTATEFCDAAASVFVSGGGGGESWSDITANTIVEIADTKALSFTDANGNVLIYASHNAGLQFAGLGDTPNAITEGPTADVLCSRNSDTGSATASIDAIYDGYTTYAGLSAYAGDGDADVNMSVTHPNFAAPISFALNGGGFVYNGLAALKLPNLTKAQRNALTPAAGMAVYQTDNTPGLRVYNGTNWMRFTETADA
jgi:hypothetical protein